MSQSFNHPLLSGIFFLLLLSLSAMPARAGEDDGTGLPIPRFVTLKAEMTNVRTGPGVRYPISWVYKRAGLPVEIIEEFDQWRKIRDFEGSNGWVHKSLLSGQRNLMITGKIRTVRHEPEDDASPLLRAGPMVIGHLLACEKEWCRTQIDSRKGWIKKGEFWGAYPREEFEK